MRNKKSIVFWSWIIILGIIALIFFSLQKKTPTILESYNNLYQRSMTLFKAEKEKTSEDGYLNLSQSEQKERFFLQKLHSNDDFWFPLPTLAQVNIEKKVINPPTSWAYITLGGEDESYYPLSYTGLIDFPDKSLRYPFELKAKYFKWLQLAIEVIEWQGNIKIEKKYMNEQEEITYHAKNYEAIKWEKLIISLFENEFKPIDPAIDKYKIYLSSPTEWSLIKYEFLFQDNAL